MCKLLCPQARWICKCSQCSRLQWSGPLTKWVPLWPHHMRFTPDLSRAHTARKWSLYLNRVLINALNHRWAPDLRDKAKITITIMESLKIFICARGSMARSSRNQSRTEAKISRFYGLKNKWMKRDRSNGLHQSLESGLPNFGGAIRSMVWIVVLVGPTSQEKQHSGSSILFKSSALCLPV